ncbi:hypothetical protein HRW23_14185 [Streptomyces lunaelactis]|uniref:hypothetical protein n=1 Tax=Streptomyces lunaelactis TaxID=1535768 RepID=UPI001584BD15|nr:hypothetical protein [Streptomyces lunaelactis]NUK71358.1 hypothetical protein [Streptomyces lunaelactis]NUK78515.1 hypothetical protein [Streptomyces lunaelactis]
MLGEHTSTAPLASVARVAAGKLAGTAPTRPTPCSSTPERARRATSNGRPAIPTDGLVYIK